MAPMDYFFPKLPGHAWECPGWVRKPANPGGEVAGVSPKCFMGRVYTVDGSFSNPAEFTSWGAGSWNLIICEVLDVWQVVGLGISEASTVFTIY